MQRGKIVKGYEMRKKNVGEPIYVIGNQKGMGNRKGNMKCRNDLLTHINLPTVPPTPVLHVVVNRFT